MTPEATVQRQLDAYNARDVDALMATYAEDAQKPWEAHSAIPKGLQSLSPALRGTSYAGSASNMNLQP